MKQAFILLIINRQFNKRFKYATVVGTTCLIEPVVCSVRLCPKNNPRRNLQTATNKTVNVRLNWNQLGQIDNQPHPHFY